MLALRTRSVGLASGEASHPRIHERSVRAHMGPRATLHLLATEDLGQLLSAVGPNLIAVNRSRRMESGMDDETSAGSACHPRYSYKPRSPTRDEL